MSSLEAFPPPDEDVDEVQCLYSIAISLKRVADLLEVTTTPEGKVLTLPQVMLLIANSLSLPGPDRGRMNLAEVIESIQSYGVGQHR